MNERPGPQGGQGLLYLTDEQLRRGIEAMFFAYRGFTADPDRILEERDYGRAHHRALHFIQRSPGTTVGNLLDILGVTKQSLNRVLRRLMEDGLVDAKVGREDRRERHLHLTDGSGSAKDEHLVPGRGTQPVAELLEHLATTSFDGHIVVEINTRKAADREARELDLL